ncbi:MAG: nitrate- and nitrite sensing domain-containing protein, partial [Acidimicrobiales bacterium]|nr:nitrate- and nitrite sensing domain-containing protein [Acidimicrobiales bacterium]
MLDDLKIRNKLILLLAGPLVITLLLSALGAKDRKASASDSSRVERLVTTSNANADVVAALQQEAVFSASFVGSDRKAWKAELTDARAATDAALGQAIPKMAHAGGGSAVATAAELAEGAAEKLGFYRKTVDQGFRNDQLDQLVVNYGQLEDTFLAVNTSIADAVSDPQAAADLRGGAALATYKSSIATQAALLAGGVEVGELAPRAFDVLEGAASAEQQQL